MSRYQAIVACPCGFRDGSYAVYFVCPKCGLKSPPHFIPARRVRTRPYRWWNPKTWGAWEWVLKSEED
jgi:predicted RNA-binding Zn-ribbon protein involved in translation (DUF1610 family)